MRSDQEHAECDWPFPFSKEEWARVGEAARDVVNASFLEDAVLHESKLEDLKNLLSELESKCGPHPVITETLADYAEETSERIGLYCKARDEALRIGGPIHTIQIALAQILLEETNDPKRALEELARGDTDLREYGDDFDRQEAKRLQEACELRQSS